MGKTTHPNNSFAHANEKANSRTLKSASSNSNIQRRRKPRSCSTRRLSVTPDSSNIIPTGASGSQQQINQQSDMSDDGEHSHTKSHKLSQGISDVFKYATKISRTEFKCNECSKVRAFYQN